MKRRDFLAGVAVVGLMPQAAWAQNFEVTRTDAEWRAMLTKAQYKVMRQEGTERAGSSPLDKVYDPGTYHCRGCDLPVYSSKAKYDSGTGWPSFWKSLPNAVRTKPDNTLLTRRTALPVMMLSVCPEP